jgi:hypothetical protein
LGEATLPDEPGFEAALISRNVSRPTSSKAGCEIWSPTLNAPDVPEGNWDGSIIGNGCLSQTLDLEFIMFVLNNINFGADILRIKATEALPNKNLPAQSMKMGRTKSDWMNSVSGL